VTHVGSAGPWNFEVGELSKQLARDYEQLVNGRMPKG
jgi:branched-chain amino acid aminotransferase